MHNKAKSYKSGGRRLLSGTDALPAFECTGQHGTMNPGNRSAFTLIELLVVVVILVIMAGLVTSAVVNSVTKAHTTESLSNLRQIMTAITMYAADHEGRFPFGIHYDKQLTPYLQNPLLSNTVYKSKNADENPIIVSENNVPITYSLHGWLTQGPDGRGRPMTVMEQPALIIIAADGVQAKNNYWQANWCFENPVSYVMEKRRSDFSAADLKKPVADVGPDKSVSGPDQAGWLRYCNNGSVACVFGDGHASVIKKGEVLVENLVP